MLGLPARAFRAERELCCVSLWCFVEEALAADPPALSEETR